MLCIENVHKSFQTEQGMQHVLRGVSMQWEDEGLLTLLGRSGSGKTTLLRLIAGYDKPDSGKILFDGTEVQKPAPERFMVFQDYNQLYPWKNVRDNVLFALRAARPGLPKPQREERADFWLSETEMLDSANQWPRQLSGGMKQRAALARAFALEPKLLLLDEPFAGLDAVLRSAMQQLLLELCMRHRVSALFVTHDIEEALLLCENPAVLLTNGTQIVRMAGGDEQRASILSLLAQE